MAEKKKIDGRTKEGRALKAKAKKATKAKKTVKKSVKAKAKAKKTGRPTIAPHVKLAKKLVPQTIVAVKSRDGIVGEVAHYIDDEKKVVIRRGVEDFAETQIIVPTVKLRPATQFESLAYIEMIELIENLQDRLEKAAGAAVAAVDAQPAIDPAFNVVETAEGMMWEET
jgi:hypothetical protein